MAEVVSTLTGKPVTPIETAEWGNAHHSANRQGSIWSIMIIDGVENWGLHVTRLSSLESARMVLEHDGLVIVSGVGQAAPYTPDGHILVLRGMASSGDFLVGDPNSPPGEDAGDPDARYTPQEIRDGLEVMYSVSRATHDYVLDTIELGLLALVVGLVIWELLDHQKNARRHRGSHPTRGGDGT